mmetsp:Transcript_103024/g.174512  ORF Transcript_103024/g.174512 Transcript_103024/m.174512 type:complete len:87 (+) Transcript_103024:651-911(+)
MEASASMSELRTLKATKEEKTGQIEKMTAAVEQLRPVVEENTKTCDRMEEEYHQLQDGSQAREEQMRAMSCSSCGQPLLKDDSMDQ